MKTLAADSTQSYSENKVLHALNSGQSDHLGRAYIPSILNGFTISGPNGHLCIVSEVAGCTIAQTERDPVTLNFPVSMARSLAVQLLLGLDYIHSCGVVHGNLHLKNILLRQHFENMTIDQLYARLEEPVRVPVKRLGEDSPGFPKYCVSPTISFSQAKKLWTPKSWSQSLARPSSKWTTQETTYSDATSSLESIFCEPVGQAADMWTLACTIYQVIDQSVLFEGLFPNEDDMVADMINILGPLPRRWWDRWEKRGELFLDNRSMRQDSLRLYLAPFRPLSERICSMGRYEFSPEEMACFANLLRAMLMYGSSDHITASVAIESEWMQGWARRSMSQTWYRSETWRSCTVSSSSPRGKSGVFDSFCHKWTSLGWSDCNAWDYYWRIDLDRYIE